jgi:hypothetical protein
MPHIDSNRRKPAAAAVLVAVLAGLLLTACGGSSKGSSSTSSTASATKTAAGARGQSGARGAALRSCLQKRGITLPQRKPGQRAQQGKAGPFGAGGAGGGLQLPKGVTRAQLQAAFKKCGGSFGGGGRGIQGAGGAQRFAKFSACMRKNGVNLPAPNTSGKGPIFNTKGIDTKGAAFKAADAKCVRELVPNGGRGGAQGAAPPGGSASGSASPGEAAPGGAPPSPE